MKPIKLYSDHSHFGQALRRELADILRPFWKATPLTEVERQFTNSHFQMVSKPEHADIIVLPLTWNHYLSSRTISQAQAVIEQARKHHKPVISYVSGDEGVRVPKNYEDVYVVRPSGRRSRKTPLQIAEPLFFPDPRTEHKEFSHYRKAEPPDLATVGFCGQATVSYSRAAFGLIRTMCRNVLHYTGLRSRENQPLYPPVLLRGKALKILSGSRLLVCRFITRTHYRGGALTPTDRNRTTKDFYRNLSETDYTLCVRGGGNFSKRFYECLAMGRIPVLVDTDCLLPFEHQIRWDDHIVRVDQKDLAHLPERIDADFRHSGLPGLERRKRACRNLWEDYLNFSSFHRRLAEIILAKLVATEAQATQLHGTIEKL